MRIQKIVRGVPFLVGMAMLGVGCNGGDLNKDNKSNQTSSTNANNQANQTTQTGSTGKSSAARMFAANNEFKRGHDDGMRDAKSAAMDMDANGLFNWIHGQDYVKGYDQGWRDEWALKRARAHAATKGQKGLQNSKSKAAPERKSAQPVASH
jgi:hypothetical protein